MTKKETKLFKIEVAIYSAALSTVFTLNLNFLQGSGIKLLDAWLFF